jgi:hypothetical protein
MPTQNRRDWVRNRARLDFRANKDETDPEKIKEMIILGETHLESIQKQAEALKLFYPEEPRSKFNDIKYLVEVRQ